jgi:hypothetical protein
MNAEERNQPCAALAAAGPSESSSPENFKGTLLVLGSMKVDMSEPLVPFLLGDLHRDGAAQCLFKTALP